MAVPAVTKEEIWSIKDLNTIYNERLISESELDDLVDMWIIDAQGFVKLRIVESFHQYISTDSWRMIIKQFCKWQSLNQIYSVMEQELVQNSYVQLVDLINALNSNVTKQAELNITPNKNKNIRFF